MALNWKHAPVITGLVLFVLAGLTTGAMLFQQQLTSDSFFVTVPGQLSTWITIFSGVYLVWEVRQLATIKEAQESGEIAGKRAVAASAMPTLLRITEIQTEALSVLMDLNRLTFLEPQSVLERLSVLEVSLASTREQLAILNSPSGLEGTDGIIDAIGQIAGEIKFNPLASIPPFGAKRESLRYLVVQINSLTTNLRRNHGK